MLNFFLILLSIIPYASSNTSSGFIATISLFANTTQDQSGITTDISDTLSTQNPVENGTLTGMNDTISTIIGEISTVETDSNTTSALENQNISNLTSNQQQTTANNYIYVPNMSEPPILTQPIAREYYSGSIARKYIRFSLSCKISYPILIRDDGARFEVTFMADDEVIKSYNTKFSELEVHLNDTRLKGYIGKKISCAVSAYFQNTTAHGNTLRSNYQKFEIKAMREYGGVMYPIDNYLTLSAGESVKLKFYYNFPRSSVHCVPYTCDGCPVQFSLAVSSDVVAVSKGCTYSTADSLDSYFEEIVITAPSSLRGTYWDYGVISVRNTHFKMLSHLLHNYEIPDIHVYVYSYPQWCYSVGDPHIYTFKNAFFSPYNVGEYYLLKSEGKYVYQEIVAMQYACADQIACNCGVWIREGNNIIEINMCSPQGGVSYPPLLRHLLTDPFRSVNVQENDWNWAKYYFIQMPSGLTVQVYAWNIALDIYIQFHHSHSVNYTGFCFVEEYDFKDISMYEVPLSKSYIFSNASPSCEAEFVSAAKVDCFCVLDRTSLVEVSECKQSSTESLTLSENDCGADKTSRRRKRATQSMMDDTITVQKEKFAAPAKHTPFAGVETWPTPKSSITYADAKEQCMSVIEASPSYQYCRNLNLTTILQSCFDDIQASDSLNFVGQIRSVFETNCKFDKEKNVVSGRDGNIKNNTEAYLTDLQNLEDVLCPNNCSGVGECERAVCKCYAGAYGDDCSLDVSVPPIIIDVLNPICDLRLYKCQNVLLHVSKAIPGKTKCQISRLNETGGALWTRISDYKANEGQASVAGCNLQRTDEPSYALYVVALSNDNAAHLSAPFQFSVFDSNCLRCDNNSCILKNETCEIQNECFKNNDINAMNPNQICNSLIDPKKWTNKTTTTPSTPLTAQTVAAVVAGPAVLLISGFVLTIAILVKKKI